MTPPNVRPGVKVTPAIAKKLQARLTELSASKELVEKELARNKQLVTKRDQQIKVLSTDLRDARKATPELKAVKAANLKLSSTVTDLQQTLRQREKDLADRDAAVKTLKSGAAKEKTELNKRVTQLSTAVAEKDSVIARQIAEIANIKARPPIRGVEPVSKGKVMTLGRVASTVAEQVSSAQDTMKTAGGFQLANVSVRLMAMTEEDGSKIRIIGANDPRARDVIGAMDEFKFDFTPSPSAPASAAGQVAVPDLSGLTPSAAQRAIAAIGLRLDTATGKPPARSKIASGQAFKQSLAPGTHVDRGIAVLVVFAE